jgi:AcrR family transcriptional regulator
VETLPLRERKKAATRSRLMEVALRLFDQRGFAATTVEEIAAAADVAPRTFFRYFPSKVDLLFADHKEFVALLQQTLATRPASESVSDAVKRAAHAWLDKVEANRSLFLVRSRLVATIPAAQAHSRYLDAEYEDLIAEAAAATRNSNPASDLQARMLARATWAATRAARDVWIATDGRQDPRALIDQAFDYLRRGLQPDPAGRRKKPPTVEQT